jgi:hydroxymethylbilane synthase
MPFAGPTAVMTMTERLLLGTRGSALALAQSGLVASGITAATGVPVELITITTRGDQIQDKPLPEIGGKGLFTAELESALRAGTIDLAVHSLKDLPTDDPDGLCLGAIAQRADHRDALVGPALSELPQGATVGTGSLRRRAQLLALRPDLNIVDIRGNVGTRLRKRDESLVDATILAMAGLQRLGIERADVHPFTIAQMVPAVGQGALAVQCRVADARVSSLLATIEHAETRRCVDVERAFLAAYGGGCNVPAGCHAWLVGDQIEATVFVSEDTGAAIRANGRGTDPEALGRHLAQMVAD